MPSSKVKPPAEYLAHWHRCLEWLAAQPGEAKITLHQAKTIAAAGTAHAKARAMRESVRQFPGWPYNVRDMVGKGQLHFSRRGVTVIAEKRFAPKSREQVLLEALATGKIEELAKNS